MAAIESIAELKGQDLLLTYYITLCAPMQLHIRGKDGDNRP
jgi:hypothetical protein